MAGIWKSTRELLELSRQSLIEKRPLYLLQLLYMGFTIFIPLSSSFSSWVLFNSWVTLESIFVKFSTSFCSFTAPSWGFNTYWKAILVNMYITEFSGHLSVFYSCTVLLVERFDLFKLLNCKLLILQSLLHLENLLSELCDSFVFSSFGFFTYLRVD